MGVLGSLCELLFSHIPCLFLYIFFIVAVCITTYWYIRPKPGMNPFAWDSRRPLRNMVNDRKLRKSILQPGFSEGNLPTDIDAIVVGSGIGGLTTAALLAKSGQKVLVLEQHKQAGGCLHTFTKLGYEFDVGIHYVGEMENMTMTRSLFEQISDGQVQWAQLDKNFDTVVFGEGNNIKSIPLRCGDKDSYKNCVTEAFPSELTAIGRYIDVIWKTRQAFIYFAMLKLLPQWLCNLILKLKLLDVFTAYGTLAKTTTQAYLDSITNDADLKAVLAYNFGDYGSIPDETSIIMQGILTGHYLRSSSYPVGGSSEIVYNIIPVIERSGGKVQTKANVKEIIFENGKAVGVVVKKGDEKTVIRAKKIVSAIGVMNTIKLLPADLASQTSIWDLVQTNKVKSGHGAVNLFVGLKGTAEELGLKATNIWAFTSSDLNGICRTYLDTEPDFENMESLPLLFISFNSAKDPSWNDRFPGKSTVTVVTFARYEWFQNWETEKVKHRGESYETFKESFKKKIWQRVTQLFPQLADKVEYMDMGSPLTNNHYIRSTKGEIYGLDHNINRFDPEVAMKLRPDINVPGLYLTGQDIMVCGFSGAMYSGLITASCILNRNLFSDLTNLHNEIKRKELSKFQSNGIKKQE